MSGIPSVPEVQILSERVICVLGQNPGKMTLTGTNTYLIGTGPKRILLDTGEGKSEYLPLLQRTMRDNNITGLQEIVITHHHYDHTGGVVQLLQQFGSLRVSKMVSPHDSVDRVFSLNEGDVIRTEGATLEAIATPGHCEDHLAFLLHEEKSIFSGDCILGAGSSVFNDLHVYLESLTKLLRFTPLRLYPGHGPLVGDGTGKIRDYIAHRHQREEQIMTVITELNGGTAQDILERVYSDTPTHMHAAAMGNLMLHLRKLLKEGRVDGSDGIWSMKVDRI